MRFLFMLSVLALVVGCGGDPASGDSDDGCGCEACGCGDEDDGGSKDYTAAAGTATIKGTVKFEGTPPKRRPIDMGSDKYCEKCYAADGKALSEKVIVGKDGGLANVFIQIKYGLRGWKFPAPTGEVLLDQVKCRYQPHVLGVQAGQKIKIRNSDPTMHNVHGLPYKGSRDVFNIAQTQEGQEDIESIRKAGMYSIKCDVHGWMQSYIGVVKHPFFAVTAEDGAFTLENVPPGEYTIEAWHEKYGTKTAKVTVADGASADASFTFSK
ncbi:MAG: carboxypeptidase regulatory-like domain-containing protein [Planctomycetota bacterium]